MRKIVVVLVVLMSATVFTIKADVAYGTNITIFDGQKADSNTWYSSESEDNEVEPGNVAAQAWDLEGFFLDGFNLTMIGGFDFIKGVTGYDSFTSGDIFIDTNGSYSVDSAISSNGWSTESNTSYGYEYLIDLDFTGLSYKVYSLSDQTLDMVFYGQNYESNPWRFTPASNAGSIAEGSITYTSFTDATALGLLGYNGNNTHYAATVNLEFLGHGQGFTTHFTMGCGNDLMYGHGVTPAPEPASMILMGIGMIGIGFGIRKKTK